MKYTIIFAFLLVLISANKVFACKCAPPLGKNEKEIVTKAKEKSAVVFSGKVTNIIGRSDGTVEVKFQVETAWKGKSFKVFSVFTIDPKTCCFCGFNFRIGEKYIVYAYGNEKPSTSTCTRTKIFENAGKDKKYLGKPISFITAKS